MLPVYIGSVLFGGVLIGASIFGGHAEGDADAGHGDGDHGDGDHGDGDHVDHGDDHGHAKAGGQLPFLSLRFWAFALAFFGLTGLALTVTGVGVLAPLIAGGAGLGAGLVSSRVLRSLASRPVGLLAGSNAHVGREGKLLLPVSPGQRGKLRVQIGGTTTDLLAETEGEQALAIGETAIIVGIRGNVALVERSPAALPPVKERERT